MKIGIYLAYQPIRNFDIKQEGLGRLLSFLVRAFINNGHQVVIACPTWVLDGLYDLFEHENIDTSKIEFLNTKSEPIVYRKYLNYLDKKAKKKKLKKRRIRRASTHFADSFIQFLFILNNYVVLAGICILGLIAGALFLPFYLLYGIGKIFARLVRKTKIINILNFITKPIHKIKRIVSEKYGVYRVLEIMREDMAKKLVSHINHMVHPADLWYSPMAFWPEFNKIKGPRVICAPDLVTSEFSTNFSNDYMIAERTDIVRKTLLNGNYFITYCEYVKDNLVVKQLGKEKSNVIAIPHAWNETVEHITVNSEIQKNFKQEANDLFAHQILQTITNRAVDLANKDFVGLGRSEINLKDIKYIFYASQLRGSKNIFNLIKAYEYLLREKYISEKLILTCNVKNNPQIADYILSHNLQYDILCFYGVSNMQLSALYACAELVVNPTLYEGGFPFTFGEGMSVGTPSIMSDIPQVREVFDGWELDEYMFDPYDYRSIAATIEKALDTLDDLYHRQKKLYDKYRVRTWNDVGQEYVEAFTHFMSLSKGDAILNE